MTKINSYFTQKLDKNYVPTLLKSILGPLKTDVLVIIRDLAKGQNY